MNFKHREFSSFDLLRLTFALSGAAALIYEVTWFRQLALFLGVTAGAVADVERVHGRTGLGLVSWRVGVPLAGEPGDRVRPD